MAAFAVSHDAPGHQTYDSGSIIGRVSANDNKRTALIHQCGDGRGGSAGRPLLYGVTNGVQSSQEESKLLGNHYNRKMTPQKNMIALLTKVTKTQLEHRT